MGSHKEGHSSKSRDGKASLELIILLPSSLGIWDYRLTPDLVSHWPNHQEGSCVQHWLADMQAPGSPIQLSYVALSLARPGLMLVNQLDFHSGSFYKLRHKLLSQAWLIFGNMNTFPVD